MKDVIGDYFPNKVGKDNDQALSVEKKNVLLNRKIAMEKQKQKTEECNRIKAY